MIRSVLSLGLLIAALYITSAAQARFAGAVAEVIDGRTMIMDSNAGRIRVQMQYVEVPEPGQAFAAVAKAHLEKLALGKTTEFRPVRLGGHAGRVC